MVEGKKKDKLDCSLSDLAFGTSLGEGMFELPLSTFMHFLLTTALVCI
jgi:hypothetical protein